MVEFTLDLDCKRNVDWAKDNKLIPLSWESALKSAEYGKYPNPESLTLSFSFYYDEPDPNVGVRESWDFFDFQLNDVPVRIDVPPWLETILIQAVKEFYD